MIFVSGNKDYFYSEELIRFFQQNLDEQAYGPNDNTIIVDLIERRKKFFYKLIIIA